jgi:hypothetical protein
MLSSKIIRKACSCHTPSPSRLSLVDFDVALEEVGEMDFYKLQLGAFKVTRSNLALLPSKLLIRRTLDFHIV